MSGLPNGWTVILLREVGILARGKSKHRPRWAPHLYNGNYPFIQTGQIKSAQKYITNFEQTYSEEGLAQSKLWEKDTLCITIAANIAEIAILKFPACFPDSVLGFIADREKCDLDYVYYYFAIVQAKLRQLAIGSVQDNINLGTFERFPFLFPPLQEQKSIAKLLSSFDEKIELLREQNETLEALAQTIFKEWFVHFNYPDATGEMVDSELGEIPKGWRVYDLKELIDTVNGYSYKGKELVESSNEALVTLKSFNRNGGSQTRGFKPFIGLPKQQQEVKVGDLVVAHTDLTQDAEVLGNPAFIFEDTGFSKMYITMDLVNIVSKNNNIDNTLVYYIMKDRRFKGHCIGYSNGTTVLHLSKKAIPEYKIALPENLQLAKEFSNYAYSLTNKISNNIYQIQTLTKTRDILLPKLMNGEVRVNL